MSRLPRSGNLTRQTLARVALRFTFVAAIAAVLSYYHVLHGLRSQALEQLEKYVMQRGMRESERFQLAGDNLRTFAAAYTRALEAMGESDPQRRFDELFERLDGGALRLQARFFHRHHLTGLVGKYIEVDSALRRRLVLGFDLLSRYGPAWQNRFVNLYLTTPENAVLMYWPGRPWGLRASSWEVQAKRPAPAADTVRIIGVARPVAAQVTWSDPYFDYAVNDWVVSASEPVHLDGQHVLSVAHDILLHDLIARTVQDSLPGTYNLVFGESGRLIAHPRLMDAIRAQGGRFSIPEAGDAQLERIYERVRRTKAQHAIIEDPQNSTYLAVARLQGPMWYLVTVFPEAIVAGHAFAIARLVLFVGALALALELLVLWFVLRHQISRPLARLMGATERVTAGDYLIRLDERPDNELGRLARSFNLMSGEIHQTLERLKESTVSRTYLDSIIQNTGEGIVTLDKRGFITSVNRAAEETFCFRAEQAVGMHAMLLLDDSVTAPYANVSTYEDERDSLFAASGAAQTMELPARRWGGNSFPMELIVTQTEHGGERLRICILRDVSDRKQAEEALRQAKDAAEAANRAKSEFLANMSHELRTPLNSVLGYAQILRSQEGLSTKQQKSLRVIQHSGEHLLGLIEEVLDLAKVEAGTLELQPAPFELPLLVESVSDSLRARARKKKLEFRVEQASHLPASVRGDERRLRQVLMNLLDNAIKYTQRGFIALRLSQHGQRLRFEVEDSGLGIEPEHLSAIFDTFHQIRNDGAFQEGAGLGLAISQRLVGLMGGALQVVSRVGAGSRFWFELTLPAAGGGAVGRELAQPLLVAGQGQGRRVLIADDREDNRGLLREMLAPLGFALCEVDDGEACLREALAWQPQVILVDLKMPVLDGEAVICRVRAAESLRKSVLIAVSASAFGYDRERAIRAGADAFLPKPVRLEALLELLQRYLELEPFFASTVRASPADRNQQPIAPVFSLPRDRWQLLTELARRGDIQQLREQAQWLQESDSRYGPFAAELGALAERFQIRRIRTLLASTRHKS